MSSSDSLDQIRVETPAAAPSLLSWDSFPEREVPFAVELMSPASEVAAVTPRLLEARDAARLADAAAHEAQQFALAQQAVFVHQLAGALEFYRSEFDAQGLTKTYRHLRVIKDQMQDNLDKAAVEIIVPNGAPYDQIVEQVEIIGWRHHADFDAERVADVIEPIIRLDGRLIRPGRVVMGAPLENADPDIVSQ
jgi:hypothetical protein